MPIADKSAYRVCRSASRSACSRLPAPLACASRTSSSRAIQMLQTHARSSSGSDDEEKSCQHVAKQGIECARHEGGLLSAGSVGCPGAARQHVAAQQHRDISFRPNCCGCSLKVSSESVFRRWAHRMHRNCSHDRLARNTKAH